MPATQERLLPVEMFDETPCLTYTEGADSALLEGSMAYCGFELEGLSGEVFCPYLGGNAYGNHDLSIVFHGSEGREATTIGFDWEEFEEISSQHDFTTDETIERIIIKAIKQV